MNDLCSFTRENDDISLIICIKKDSQLKYMHGRRLMADAITYILNEFFNKKNSNTHLFCEKIIQEKSLNVDHT